MYIFWRIDKFRKRISFVFKEKLKMIMIVAKLNFNNKPNVIIHPLKKDKSFLN